MKYILDRILPELRELMGAALRLYEAGKLTEALQELDQQLDRLEVLVTDADRREALRWNLLHTRLGIIAGFGTDMRSEMDAFLAELREPVSTAMGNAERESMLVRQLTIRDGMLAEPFTEQEFMTMLERIPPEACSIRFWSDVSLWAFRNGYAEPLQAAVEHALLNPAPAHEVTVWKRIHLMFGSVSGSLREAALLNYIDCVDNLAQLRELEVSIIERLRDRGQWSEAAESSLQNLRAQLQRTELAH
ncbi:MAG: hypothetical protein R3F46_08160 [bacterium]